MYDRLERFVVCVMKPLDGLVFVFVIVNGMIGVTILANILGSRFLMFAGCGFGLLIQAACVAIFYRHSLRPKDASLDAQEQQLKAQDQWNRLPIEFIATGAISVAFYPWAMLLSMYWPSLHPFRGEVSVRCMAGILLAVILGNTLVGIAGLVDRRICLAVHYSAKKQHLPLWSRFAGWIILLAGMTSGGYLAYLIAA